MRPDSTIKFGKSTDFSGFAYGRKIRLGKGSRAVLKNFLEDSVVEGN